VSAKASDAIRVRLRSRIARRRINDFPQSTRTESGGSDSVDEVIGRRSCRLGTIGNSRVFRVFCQVDLVVWERCHAEYTDMIKVAYAWQG
jgi:hypothetical protein